MKKRVKEKWIAALKSNRYKQSDCALRSPRGFCCLGVLCDLYIKEMREKGKVYSWKDKIREKGCYEFKDNDGYLPYEVQDWAGLETADIRITDHKTLSNLNDSGTSFKELAKIIEEYL